MARLAPSALLLSALVASPVAADTVHGTRGTVLEEAHRLDVRVAHGHATIVARRTFLNEGPRFDQVVVEIDGKPDGAAATGLRTQSIANGKPVWYVADLLDAEVAAERYRELTGVGGFYPKDPALLSLRGWGDLVLQVFPIEPRGRKTVEYTLEVPLSYRGGKFVLPLPAMGTTTVPASMTVDLAEGSAGRLAIDGIAVHRGAARRLFAGADVTLAPDTLPTLGGIFAGLGFAKGKAVARTAIRVAPKLPPPPSGAHVVLVADVSRSMTRADRAAELGAARAYLAHLPGCQVEIVVFDRSARRATAGFVTPEAALSNLETELRSSGNGSALDEALAVAAQRIAAAPPGAPRRVVVMTDLLTASTLIPEALAARRLFEGTGAIVHLATVASGPPSLTRVDGDPWSAIPRATGGLLFATTGSDHANDREGMRSVFEEWARPVRVDRLAFVDAPMLAGIELPSSIAEGEGFEDLQILAAVPSAVRIRGELWSSSIVATLSATDDDRRRAAAFAAIAAGDDLSDDELRVLATKGHAVSRMTSLLAIEPGVRPSTEGLEEQGFGFGGIGAGGGGLGRGVGLGPTFDGEAWLRARISTMRDACKEPHAPVTVRLETTRAEIVAVSVAARPALASCIAKAVWDLEVPEVFGERFAKHEITLEP
jgi:hypothetical protein